MIIGKAIELKGTVQRKLTWVKSGIPLSEEVNMPRNILISKFDGLK
jgi:hypothetical protein